MNADDTDNKAKNKKAIISLLMEEWKQNVSLYIDQDRRGLERIKMFLTVHAGLLIFYGILWKSPPDVWSVRAAWIIAVAAVVYTIITHLMSKRAQAFILLRKLQGMLIEKEIKNLISPNAPWRTSEGIVTTFTREHVSFKRKKTKMQPGWTTLIDEVDEMGSDASSPITLQGHWNRSIGHLNWLISLYVVFYFLWTILGILITFAYYYDC